MYINKNTLGTIGGSTFVFEDSFHLVQSKQERGFVFRLFECLLILSPVNLCPVDQAKGILPWY